jgi:hypothetical protein
MAEDWLCMGRSGHVPAMAWAVMCTGREVHGLFWAWEELETYLARHGLPIGCAGNCLYRSGTRRMCYAEPGMNKALRRG